MGAYILHMITYDVCKHINTHISMHKQLLPPSSHIQSILVFSCKGCLVAFRLTLQHYMEYMHYI